MSKHTKAGRRERFRCHATGEARRIPVAMRLCTRRELSPEAWAKVCELSGLDPEVGWPTGGGAS